MQLKKIIPLSLIFFVLFSPSLLANQLSGQDLKIFNQANIAMSQHSWEQADKILSQLHQQFPDNDYITNNLAVTYFNQGRLDEAQELFSEVIRLTEPTRTAFQNLQTLYGYSAAKAYSKGLNLLKPIELPNMIVRAYRNKDDKNSSDIALNKQSKPKKITTQQPNDVVAMLNSDQKEYYEYQSEALRDNSELGLIPAPIARQPVNMAVNKPTQQKSSSDNKTQLKSKQAKKQTKVVQVSTDKKNKVSITSEKAILLEQLSAWANAWSNGNINTYLGFYSPNYSPRGKSRKSWLKNRRSRVKPSKKIQIGLSKQEVFVNKNKTQANILFVQNYRSKNYQDKVKKRITWVKRKGVWRIAKEVIIKTL